MIYQTRVAGVVAENRQDILKQLPQNVKLQGFYLVPEPENPYDKNAIAVYVAKFKIGYIPKGHMISEKVRSGIDMSVSGIVVGGYDGKNYGVILTCKSDEPDDIEISNLKE